METLLSVMILSHSRNIVHIKWLAAPINPADLNTLEGVYPVKPPLPAVPGLEGYGRVEKIGSRVKKFRVGDHVLPAKADMGTWRTDGYHDEADLVAIDNSLSMEASATLLINPPTAYRMLKDFVDLKPGDTIIQNGANSAVGRAVIQAPTGPFIFKDIRLIGFWITPWFDDVKNAEERKRMFAELSGWMKSGKFIPPPLEKRNIEDFASAIEAAVKFGKKQLLVM
ncbi:unnamed protein product [Nippostrongylus brasiliensis]|uniref:Enoyl-[acyl-carrier-protein] reductase, mitochondrial n=1 Tax=Nippostrongylus brasiliensis TaxID=27835 RepID=A0A0N4Y0C4_NIPBR|nr:unnamed protein product [Nippostrongylus brasiliensis]